MDNYFGLGFVLNVEDNASSAFGAVDASMQNLMSTSQQTFMSMNMAGMALNQLGEGALNAGQKITSGFVNMGKQVISTGDDFEKTKLTLEALYKSSEIAEEKMSWLQSYAAKTPFEITDLKSVMVGMKAIGIEASQTVTSIGGYKQELMGFVGDLGALRPDLPMQRIMQGVRNALGGNVKSLNEILDVNTTTILGRKFGAGGKEQAYQDIADLVDKMGASGLMNKLNGTWTQMMSNLHDTSTMFLKSIADGGAFASAKNTLKYVSDALAGLTSNKDGMKQLGDALSGAFQLIWMPIDLVIKGITNLTMGLTTLTQTHPMLAKIVLGFVALAGALLIGTGLFFKFAGGIMMALGGLGMLITTIVQFGGVANIIRVISSAMGGLVASVLPLIALIGLVFLAWKNNFLGIREMTITFVNNTKLAFSESTRIANASFSDFSMGLSNLQDRIDSGDIFGGLTLNLLKLQILWMAVVDSWNDGGLPDELFKKVEALGLLPVLSFIQDLHRNFNRMWQGFKMGFESILSVVLIVGGAIGKAILKIGEHLNPVIVTVGEFIGEVNKVSGDKFENLGDIIGKIAGIFVTYKIVSLFGGLALAVGKTASSFGKLALSLATNPFTWIVLAIVATVVAFNHFYKTSPEFKEKIDSMVKSVMPFIDTIKSKLVPVIASIVSTVKKYMPVVVQVFNSIWGVVSGIIMSVVGFIQENLPQIQEIFKSVWDVICGVVEIGMKFIEQIVIPVIMTIWRVVQENMPLIQSIIGSVVKIIMSVFQGLCDLISRYVVPGVKTLIDIISIFIPPLAEIVCAFARGAIKGLDIIISGFSKLVGWVKDAIHWLKSWNDTDMQSKSATVTTNTTNSEVVNTGGHVDKTMLRLSTGGEVNAEGMAVLHPNEVVVNGDLTNKLRTFLSANVANGSTPSIASIASTNSQSRNAKRGSSLDGASIDNSITFGDGSIQITMTNGNEADVNRLVKLVGDKLQKQNQVNRMRNYQPI